MAESKCSKQRISLGPDVCSLCPALNKESTKEDLNWIAIHLAQINPSVSQGCGWVGDTKWLFCDLCLCLSLVTLCFCSQVLPPACVCIFIYAVDGNNLLENVYFMTRSVTLLDIIRGLKN